MTRGRDARWVCDVIARICLAAGPSYSRSACFGLSTIFVFACPWLLPGRSEAQISEKGYNFVPFVALVFC